MCVSPSQAITSQLECKTCSLRARMEKYDFWHSCQSFFFLFFFVLSHKSAALKRNLIVIHCCRRAQNTFFHFTETPSRLLFLMFNGEHSFVIIRKRNPFESNDIKMVDAQRFNVFAFVFVCHRILINSNAATRSFVHCNALKMKSMCMFRVTLSHYIELVRQNVNGFTRWMCERIE